jgi:hypothetical protein
MLGYKNFVIVIRSFIFHCWIIHRHDVCWRRSHGDGSPRDIIPRSKCPGSILEEANVGAEGGAGGRGISRKVSWMSPNAMRRESNRQDGSMLCATCHCRRVYLMATR